MTTTVGLTDEWGNFDGLPLVSKGNQVTTKTVLTYIKMYTLFK